MSSLKSWILLVAVSFLLTDVAVEGSSKHQKSSRKAKATATASLEPTEEEIVADLNEEAYSMVGVRPDEPGFVEAYGKLFSELKRTSDPPLTNDTVLRPSSTTPVDGWVKRKGSKLSLKGKHWFFAGTNVYGIAAHVERWTEEQILSTLNAHAGKGANALRIWCFNDGYGEYEPWRRPYPFQPKPGVYNDANLRRLDFVLHHAQLLGIRIICAMANNLPDFGGKQWYVRSLLGPDAPLDDFYTAWQTREAYANWVYHLLHRTNYYNKRVYKDDPTILAWELINEPTTDPGYDQARGQKPGTAIANWVDEMAKFIKKYDSRHLLAVGDEGYRTDARGDIPGGWANDGYKGVDFRKHVANPLIDIATLHYYGESFGVEPWNATYFFQGFAANRAKLAFKYRKAIILEEIGMTTGYQPSRNGFLDYVFAATNYHGFVGNLVWQVRAPASAERWPATHPFSLGTGVLAKHGTQCAPELRKWLVLGRHP
jgi:mannan endo-1,4-beta-mannosidase